jgi:hypothetical protein
VSIVILTAPGDRLTLPLEASEVQTRPHAMLVEGHAGTDAGLDACLERVQESHVIIVRFANLWQALTELRHRQSESGFTALGVLDLLGHGEAGALSVGDALLTADPHVQRVLAQLLNPPGLVDAQTVLRLLGCGVGMGGRTADLPLGAAGDGPLLAMSLKRRLGCRVQVALLGVDPHDFAASGYAVPENLAEAVDAERCVLVAVTASPTAP